MNTMISEKALESSTSLRDQVNGLENQLMLRRQRVHALKVNANQKMAAWLTSPIMLLAAVGAGVAMEQAGHRRTWSVAQVMQAANAGLGLLMMLTSFGQQIAGSDRAPGP